MQVVMGRIYLCRCLWVHMQMSWLSQEAKNECLGGAAAMCVEVLHNNASPVGKGLMEP